MFCFGSDRPTGDPSASSLVIARGVFTKPTFPPSPIPPGAGLSFSLSCVPRVCGLPIRVPTSASPVPDPPMAACKC